MRSPLRALWHWLRILFTIEEDEYGPGQAPPVPQRGETVGAAPAPSETLPEAALAEALGYREQILVKLQTLAADFNAGTINRVQFRDLYAHYQRQLQSVEQVIDAAQDPDADWRGSVAPGQSVFIRRQHIARARGYAIFENDSGMPLSTLGRFELDPALLVPMLAAYRSAAKEAFGAGTRSTEMEDGRWMCFVPGEYTTLLAVFSAEPAGKQLEFLERLHQHFEQANHRHLVQPPVQSAELIFPHEYYLGQWRR